MCSLHSYVLLVSANLVFRTIASDDETENVREATCASLELRVGSEKLRVGSVNNCVAGLS